jgi:hypothetical protein
MQIIPENIAHIIPIHHTVTTTRQLKRHHDQKYPIELKPSSSFQIPTLRLHKLTNTSMIIMIISSIINKLIHQNCNVKNLLAAFTLLMKRLVKVRMAI